MMNGGRARCIGRVREAGFTLLELLVVLGVLALVIAAVKPFMARRAVGIDVVAAQVATSLRAAREAAIAYDRPVSLLISGNGGSYRFSTAHAGVQLPAGMQLSYQATAGFHRAGLGEALAFFVDGTSTGGMVVLRDGRGAIVLKVEPISGAVNVGNAP